MLNYKDAYNIIKTEFEKLNFETENVLLLESVGRYLAEDIKSDIDIPLFNHSAVDGFAIKYNENIKSWEVVGEISAGHFEEFPVDDYHCVLIMAGARMPQNADTVIPIEDVEVNNNVVKLISEESFNKGYNVRTKSEDLRKDEVAITSNAKIFGNHIPLLASCGKRTVKVFKKLVVGVITTGNELIDIDFTPEAGQVRASNLYTLLSDIKSINMQPLNFGIVKDTREVLKEKISDILDKDIDILIVSGGVSLSKYDYLRKVLAENGAEEIFWKVNIEPGNSLMFAKYNNREKNILIFGLPGNPVSTFVNFRVFIKPVIDEILGHQSPEFFTAILQNEIIKEDGKRHFLRGHAALNEEKNQMEVQKIKLNSSGDILSLKEANCLIVFEEESNFKAKGEQVICIRI